MEGKASHQLGYAEFCSLPQDVGDATGLQTIGLKTVNSKLYFTNSLKLVVAKSHCFPSSANCLWMYKLFSGGVLNGDQCVSLDVVVGENCNVVLTTQEYPKIAASSSGLVSKQVITGRVDDNGLLAVLPDPVLCYKDAKYNQQQVYKLSSCGNLILLDWVIAGRIALGDIWDMKSYVSENKVYVNGHLVFGDAINLGNHGHDERRKTSLKDSLQHTKVLGSCLFIGPHFMDLKWTLKEKVLEITGSESDGLTAAVSLLSQTFCDGIVVKLLSAQSSEQARCFFRRLIEDTTLLIGGDPLER